MVCFLVCCLLLLFFRFKNCSFCIPGLWVGAFLHLQSQQFSVLLQVHNAFSSFGEILNFPLAGRNQSLPGQSVITSSSSDIPLNHICKWFYAHIMFTASQDWDPDILESISQLTNAIYFLVFWIKSQGSNSGITIAYFFLPYPQLLCCLSPRKCTTISRYRGSCYHWDSRVFPGTCDTK